MRTSLLLVLSSLTLVACGGSTVTPSENPTDGATTGDTLSSGGDTGTSPNDSTTSADDSATTTDDSATTANDTATSGDSNTGISCGTSTCTGTDVCCVTVSGTTASYACAASCPDGGFTEACDGPEDCTTGGNKYCCGQFAVSGTSLSAADAQCTPTCNTSKIGLGTTSGQARFCHTADDCKDDANNPSCCTFANGGNKATICVPKSYEAFATCP